MNQVPRVQCRVFNESLRFLHRQMARGPPRKLAKEVFVKFIPAKENMCRERVAKGFGGERPCD